MALKSPVRYVLAAKLAVANAIEPNMSAMANDDVPGICIDASLIICVCVAFYLAHQ